MVNEILCGFYIISWVYAAYSDYKKKIIPPTSNIILICCAIGLLLNKSNDIVFTILGLVPAAVFLIATLFKFDVIGGGDIKLIAASGACIGFELSIVSILISFIVLFIYSIIKKKKGNMVPLAVFLILGYLPLGIIEILA